MHCSNNKLYKCKANNFQARLWQALVEWPCRDSQRDDTHSDHPCTLQSQIKSDIVGIDFAIQLEDHFQQATQIQVWSKTVQKQTRPGQKSFFSTQPTTLAADVHLSEVPDISAHQVQRYPRTQSSARDEHWHTHPKQCTKFLADSLSDPSVAGGCEACAAEPLAALLHILVVVVSGALGSRDLPLTAVRESPLIAAGAVTR